MSKPKCETCPWAPDGWCHKAESPRFGTLLWNAKIELPTPPVAPWCSHHPDAPRVTTRCLTVNWDSEEDAGTVILETHEWQETQPNE